MKKRVKRIVGSYTFIVIVMLFSVAVAIANTVLLINSAAAYEEKITTTIPKDKVVEAVASISIKDVLEQQQTIVYEEYTIERGDTLWGISKSFYGDGNHYSFIERCNNLYGSNRNLVNGMVIRIYPLDYTITEEEIEENGIAKAYSLRSPYLDIPRDVDISTMEYYGNIHVTGYDPLCDHCCGKHDGITASGNYFTYYKTVACNSLPFGTEIYIEGYGFFVVEDRGGATLGIDIACEDHNACKVMSSPGEDIYIVKWGNK